ncbi:SsgA family sporulation/cell division regulator [Streptomyces typhae]|nr:SsgA family sporulation/cell division regulator [Streptomyces typhae]
MELETGEDGAGRAPLSAELAYAAADPFAVTMTFYCDGDEVTRWRLDRQQLAEGCRYPVGEGDVRIAPAPAPGAARGTRVRVELLGTPGPAGRDRAVLYAATADVTAFLATAHAVVPPGEERVCLDDLVSRLVREASPVSPEASSPQVSSPEVSFPEATPTFPVEDHLPR